MWANAPDPSEPYGPRFRERYGLAPDFFIDQGESGEMMADRFELTREELDAFAVEYTGERRRPRRPAASATRSSRCARRRTARSGRPSPDEGIRPGTTLERLAGLRTVFRDDGRLTAATSSHSAMGRRRS